MWAKGSNPVERVGVLIVYKLLHECGVVHVGDTDGVGAAAAADF